MLLFAFTEYLRTGDEQIVPIVCPDSHDVASILRDLSSIRQISVLSTPVNLIFAAKMAPTFQQKLSLGKHLSVFSCLWQHYCEKARGFSVHPSMGLCDALFALLPGPIGDACRVLCDANDDDRRIRVEASTSFF